MFSIIDILYILKALPSFGSPFFAEEALDGLLDRNASSTTHLSLILMRLLDVHDLSTTHLPLLLLASVYLEILKTVSIQEGLFQKQEPLQTVKSGKQLSAGSNRLQLGEACRVTHCDQHSIYPRLDQSSYFKQTSI